MKTEGRKGRWRKTRQFDGCCFSPSLFRGAVFLLPSLVVVLVPSLFFLGGAFSPSPFVLDFGVTFFLEHRFEINLNDVNKSKVK